MIYIADKIRLPHTPPSSYALSDEQYKCIDSSTDIEIEPQYDNKNERWNYFSPAGRPDFTRWEFILNFFTLFKDYHSYFIGLPDAYTGMEKEQEYYANSPLMFGLQDQEGNPLIYTIYSLQYHVTSETGYQYIVTARNISDSSQVIQSVIYRDTMLFTYVFYITNVPASVDNLVFYEIIDTTPLPCVIEFYNHTGFGLQSTTGNEHQEYGYIELYGTTLSNGTETLQIAPTNDGYISLGTEGASFDEFWGTQLYSEDLILYHSNTQNTFVNVSGNSIEIHPQNWGDYNAIKISHYGSDNATYGIILSNQRWDDYSQDPDFVIKYVGKQQYATYSTSLIFQNCTGFGVGDVSAGNIFLWRMVESGHPDWITLAPSYAKDKTVTYSRLGDPSYPWATGYFGKLLPSNNSRCGTETSLGSDDNYWTQAYTQNMYTNNMYINDELAHALKVQAYTIYKISQDGSAYTSQATTIHTFMPNLLYVENLAAGKYYLQTVKDFPEFYATFPASFDNTNDAQNTKYVSLTTASQYSGWIFCKDTIFKTVSEPTFKFTQPSYSGTCNEEGQLGYVTANSLYPPSKCRVSIEYKFRDDQGKDVEIFNTSAAYDTGRQDITDDIIVTGQMNRWWALDLDIPNSLDTDLCNWTLHLISTTTTTLTIKVTRYHSQYSFTVVSMSGSFNKYPAFKLELLD